MPSNLRRLPTAIPFFALLVCSAHLHAQAFPSDSLKPAQAGAAPLLEAVCPGQVLANPPFGCAAPCPKLTAAGTTGNWPTGNWTLEAVTRGHFLSANGQDAVLAMKGCEPAAPGFGTVLLSQQSGAWKVVWYKAGIDTSQCHKVPLRSARELLVCKTVWGTKGRPATGLFFEDLLAPANPEAPNAKIFETADDLPGCGVDGHVSQANMDAVAFEASESHAEPVIVVTVSSGRKSLTAKEAKACADGQAVAPPKMTVHNLEFEFDGRAYRISPQSARALQLVTAP